MNSGRGVGGGERMAGAGRGKRGKANSPDRMAEDAWNKVIDRLDGRLLRRAKLAAKQREMGSVTVLDNRITATVHSRGPDKWIGQVSVPLVDKWQPYHRSVATWFCQRPDWLAALLADQWNEEFLSFLASSGLHLFPNSESIEDWLAQAKCGCDDLESPCRHIASLIVQLANEVVERPVCALTYVGLSIEDLLDEAHQLTVLQLGEGVLQTNTTEGHREEFVGFDEWQPWIEETVLMSSVHDSNGIMRVTEDGSDATGSANFDVVRPRQPLGGNATKLKASVMAPTFHQNRVAELSVRYLRLT